MSREGFLKSLLDNGAITREQMLDVLGLEDSMYGQYCTGCGAKQLDRIFHENTCPFFKMEKSVNPRYFACTSCKVQTEIADLEGQEVFHSPCGGEMLEISRKLPYGAYPYTGCWHIKKQEKSVEFEIGDKVSAVGTIGQFWRHHGSGQLMTDVKFDSEQNAACIPVSMLTLVERPVKFEKGKIYRRKDRGVLNDQQYMYLGDMRFYSYMSREVLVKQPTSEWLKILVPVEES